MRFLLALFLLAAAACAEEAKADKEGAKAIAEIRQKLDEQSKKQVEQDKELEEVRKKLAVQEAENEKLQKEVASEKVENLEERKAESMLRDADAKLRLADVQILKISEKQRAENHQAAPKAKRQNDVITEARKLMVEEIRKYLATKNYTANLKKLIDSEIRRLATPPKTGIARIEDSGTPGAISKLDGNYYPKYAFQNAARIYHSKEGLPQIVWMRYSKPHRLAKISFSSVQANLYMVKKFAVVGSNDCSTWTTLLAVNNAGFPNDSNQGTTRTWMIPAEDRMSFKCIGLKAIEFTSYSDYKYLALNNVRMWEEV